jgi:hypothetical protein
MPATVTPEQMAPEPISQTATPASGMPGRQPATPAQVALSIVPGLGHFARGEWIAGMALFLAWGFTLSLTAWWPWSRWR